MDTPQARLDLTVEALCRQYQSDAAKGLALGKRKRAKSKNIGRHYSFAFPSAKNLLKSLLLRASSLFTIDRSENFLSIPRGTLTAHCVAPL
jgi:hypothetical protein